MGHYLCRLWEVTYVTALIASTFTLLGVLDHANHTYFILAYAARLCIMYCSGIQIQKKKKKKIPMRMKTARPPHLDSWRGRGDWVGGCDAERCFRKACTKDLKKSQHSSGNDGNIHAPDRACSGAWPKPLPNILPKFLSSECHPVHAE